MLSDKDFEINCFVIGQSYANNSIINFKTCSLNLLS